MVWCLRKQKWHHIETMLSPPFHYSAAQALSSREISTEMHFIGIRASSMQQNQISFLGITQLWVNSNANNFLFSQKLNQEERWSSSECPEGQINPISFPPSKRFSFLFTKTSNVEWKKINSETRFSISFSSHPWAWQKHQVSHC